MSIKPVKVGIISYGHYFRTNFVVHLEECSSIEIIGVYNRSEPRRKQAEDDGYFDPYQIYHIDAFCNECGNCARFCPYTEGRPYKDKFTVFSFKEDFDNSTNPGFFAEGENLLIRAGEIVETLELKNGKVTAVPDHMKQSVAMVEVILREHPWVTGKVEK